MKTSSIYPLFILFLAGLLGCQPDTAYEDAQNSTSANLTAHQQRKGETIPSNSKNIYDEVGRLHVAILSSYYEHPNSSANIGLVVKTVDSIAALQPGFTTLLSQDYLAATATRIEYLNTLQGSPIEDVLGNTSMTGYGKKNVAEFLNHTLRQIAEEVPIALLHESILTYEDAVLSDSILQERDKEIILITTSIVRHTIHFRKKKPKKNTDPDWDWLTLTFMGAVEGADDGAAQAITYSVAYGIVENRK